MKHYFQSGQEDFRNALHSAMPQLLTQGRENLLAESAVEYEIDSGSSDKLERTLEVLEGVNSPKYNKQIKEAMQLIENAKSWYDSTILREAAPTLYRCIRLTRKLVADGLHKKQNQHVILVLACIHAPAYLVTASPQRGIKFRLLDRHSTRLAYTH